MLFTSLGLFAIFSYKIYSQNLVGVACISPRRGSGMEVSAVNKFSRRIKMINKEGNIEVISIKLKCDKSNIAELEITIKDHLRNVNLIGATASFDFSSALIVTSDAFDRLKILCNLCIEKGMKIIFVNPSIAMKDFLMISKDFPFEISTS